MKDAADKKKIRQLIKNSRLGHKLSPSDSKVVVDMALSASDNVPRLIEAMKIHVEEAVNTYVEELGGGPEQRRDNANAIGFVMLQATKIACESLLLGSDGEARPMLEGEIAAADAEPHRGENYILRVLTDVINSSITEMKQNTNLMNHIKVGRAIH